MNRTIFSYFFRICFGLLLVTGLLNVNSFAVNAADADNPRLWQLADQDNLPARGARLLTPEKYLVFRLNSFSLERYTREMPLEFTNEARMKNVVIELPMPDGTLQRFQIEDSPVLAPHLATDFPEWRTFQGYGIDDATATARLDWTDSGFHGYVLTNRGTVYIDPLQENDKENYLVYYKHEYGRPQAGDFKCGVDDLMSKLAPVAESASPDAVQFAYGTQLKTYRIAVATTGEWSRGTTASTDPQTVRTAALAALTTGINRLDGIFRREAAATFQIVNPPITNDATNIIFDDPATDPYNNTDAEAQLNINQTTIDARVGAANYDVGHLYGTGGGGVASSPSICSPQKAEGYSARAGFYGDPFTVDYVAHEIGHQFGGSHTYNNVDQGGACTTRSTQNAFEVASGSTIMSYVGICNIRNLQQYVDTGIPAFHIRSLTQITTNLNDTSQGAGGSCGTPVAGAANSIPTVNAGANFTIPRLTPFTLTATGDDSDAADVANLLYSWEQYDLAPSGTGQLGTPALVYDVDTDGVQRPLFRAYSPVASPSRTFPSLAFILNPANNVPSGSNTPPLTYQGNHPNGAPGASCQAGNECVIGENLPSIARTMNFRVAVRDRRGGIADAGMTVTTVSTSGPFQITTQNTTPTAWAAGSTQTVTWDVVGSDAAPINAANVKISLSTDGGQTFPITLVASTPNDGTQTVTVPNNATAEARIKVEAVGNIFFDINNANFAITGASPGVDVGDARAAERPAGENRPAGEGSIDFTISLSAPSAQPVTVRVSTNSLTATEGVDFVAVDNFDVVFPAGTLTQTVSVPTIEDPGDEPDETFTLDVVGVVNATVADGQGLGTIVDDDAPAGAARTIRMTNVAGSPGQNVTVPILLDSLGNESSISLSLNFNPALLTNPTVALGTGVPAGSNLGTNITQSAQGRIGILVDSTNTYAAGTQQIVRVTFSIPAGAQLALTPITFGSIPTVQSVSSNTGTLLSTTYIPGTVQVGSTSAGVLVSGRVLTHDGRGVRNAVVTLTAADGSVRRVITSSFGVYRLEDVESGQTYVISALLRRYRFPPRVVQVVDSIVDLDLIGTE
jgi:Metallo-peptidase family M12B Reprolysin-like/Calx-beta domain